MLNNPSLIQSYPPPQKTHVVRQTSEREQASDDIICDIASTRANEKTSMKKLILADSHSSMWRSTCAAGSASLPHDHDQSAAAALYPCNVSLQWGWVCAVAEIFTYMLRGDIYYLVICFAFCYSEMFCGLSDN